MFFIFLAFPFQQFSFFPSVQKIAYNGELSFAKLLAILQVQVHVPFVHDPRLQESVEEDDVDLLLIITVSYKLIPLFL